MTWKNKELKTTTHYLILTNQSITKLLLQPLNSKGGLLILIKKQNICSSRGQLSSPICHLLSERKVSGSFPMNSTLKTSWMIRGNLWSPMHSCLSLQVCSTYILLNSVFRPLNDKTQWIFINSNSFILSVVAVLSCSISHTETLVSL